MRGGSGFTELGSKKLFGMVLNQFLVPPEVLPTIRLIFIIRDDSSRRVRETALSRMMGGCGFTKLGSKKLFGMVLNQIPVHPDP